MSIRLWPQDFERKDHITKAEKALLRYASRNFQNGHMAIGKPKDGSHEPSFLPASKFI